MAKIIKKQVDEREFIVPLRRSWLKVPEYKRAKRAVKELKMFIAKHMRVVNRDIKKVKLDKWLNHEIWFRGIRKPPTKIRVKAKRDGENIRVELAEIPESIKFKVEKEKVEEKKKEEEKKEEKKVEEEKKEEKGEEEEEEKEEKVEEKKEAVREAGKVMAEEKAREQKHEVKIKTGPKRQIRKALKK